MLKNLTQEMNKVVFLTSSAFIILITFIASVIPKKLGSVFSVMQAWIISNIGWMYILSVGTILFFSIWLMLSRFRDIKLGPDHSTPDYTDLSWFAMLFSAGMGTGLMFWGVAEPIKHFLKPPLGEPSSIFSAQEAMKISFFHWGLHAWAIYASLAVILAYFAYRKNLPLLPRSMFYPLIGKKIFGPIGDIVDIFSIIGTMFGVASSLGMGVTQVNAGLNYVFGLPINTTVQVVLIAIITSFATISVVLGLDGGIKKLSNINIILAVALMLSFLVLGDTVYIIKSFVQNTGAYLSDVIYKTFNLYAYEKKEKWIGGWTLLYWAWWIAWAPFVGIFVARISRGRTIKEFMKGVLFIPTGFTFIWMTVFGNSGINLILNKGKTEMATAVNDNVATALFKFFEFFPMTGLLSILGVCLVITFFVSSSDSGSLVIDTLASGGRKEPPVWQRIFWAVLEGLVAATLLIAGGLDALQTMTIISAFPIIVVICIGGWGFIKSLHQDYLHQEIVQNHQTVIQYSEASTNWKERLDNILTHPKEELAKSFLTQTVLSSLTELKNEFESKGFKSNVIHGDSSVALNVSKDNARDFKYEVKLRTFDIPEHIDSEVDDYYRAEVFLISGGQQYDIYGYTKQQLMADAITQYEKHVQYIHAQEIS